MNNFWDTIDDCGLRDMAFEGYEFTFDNGQEGDTNRQSRLDRAMMSEGWLDIFPYARFVHLNREWSYHALIKVVFDMRLEVNDKSGKIFRFEEIWEGEDGGRSASQIRDRKNLVTGITHLLKQEELFWRQRSRVLWLRDGDNNTKFFHRKAGQRKQKNNIRKILDKEGRIYTRTDHIDGYAVSYFSKLLSSSESEEFSGLLGGIEGRVTIDMNTILRADYSAEEVVTTLN
ncbi:uncharacterized protein LOC141643244 [Silene latifolia]|uniref:uncharacterized protein LOC141643244 n=1 Tax=Silene latifolia TaxID=37657 RepID=UPI003D76EF21